jgi:hypothetical protein
MICTSILFRKLFLWLRKPFSNLKLKAENFQKIGITRTIHSKSKKSQQFLKQNTYIHFKLFSEGFYILLNLLTNTRYYLLKGIDNCLALQLSKLLDSFWQPVLATVFLYFNFSTFTNNVELIWFPIIIF